MNTKIAFLFLIFALSCTSENKVESPTVSSNPKSKTAEIVDQYLSDEVQKGFSGTIMMIENGLPILVKGYGNKTADGGSTIDKNTLFDMGSISKSFTATAILKLEEAGKLSVENPISQYFKNISSDKKNITIHQLLTHSSGLLGAIGYDYDSISEADFLQQIWDSKLLFQSGTSYEYSNVGYSLLGLIIEMVSGESYDQFLQKNIFLPAKMPNTGYTIKGNENQNVAHGIDREGNDWGNPKEKKWNGTEPFWHLKANGGILTTATDMSNWFDAISNDKILKPATFQKQLKGYVDEGGGTFYGYGIVEFQPEKHYGHNGGNGIFRADWHFFPEKNAALFMASNSANVPLFEISENILQVMFTGELPKIVDLQPVDMNTFPSSSMEKTGAAFFDILQNSKASENFVNNNFSEGIVERNSKEKILKIIEQLQTEFKGADIVEVGIHENMLSIKTKGGAEKLTLNLNFLDGKIDKLSVVAEE